MKVMADLNVLMDVLQRREPFFASAAALCDWGSKMGNSLAVPAHAVTTVAYIVRKTAGAKAERTALEWLLGRFELVPADTNVFRLALSLEMDDYEDAVVAASAKLSGCSFVATRNLQDFAKSPVTPVMPSEFLASLPVTAGTDRKKR